MLFISFLNTTNTPSGSPSSGVVSGVQTHTNRLSCTQRLVCELWRTETCVYKVESGFPLIFYRSARGWGFPWVAFDSCSFLHNQLNCSVLRRQLQCRSRGLQQTSEQLDLLSDILKWICHHPVLTFHLCQEPRMNFNDMAANNWKKDQILCFLLLHNHKFCSFKKNSN